MGEIIKIRVYLQASQLLFGGGFLPLQKGYKSFLFALVFLIVKFAAMQVVFAQNYTISFTVEL